MFDRRIIKAAGWIGIGNVASQIVAFFIFVFLSWMFTKNEYGYLRWVIQMGLLLATISVAGFPSALARFIAADKRNLKKASVYFSNAVSGVLIITIGVIMASYIIFKDTNLIFVVIGYVPVLLYLGVLRGFVDYRKIGIFNLFRNIIKLILLSIIVLIPFFRNITYVIVVFAFGGWIVMILLEKRRSMKVIFKKEFFSVKNLKKLIKFSIFSFISTISYSAIPSISYTILGLRFGYSEVALFSVALTLCIVYGFVPGAVNTVLMPKIAENNTFSKSVYYLKHGILLTLLFSLIIFIMIGVFGKWGISILFGDRYIESYKYLIVLSIGSILSKVRNNFTALWQGINKPYISASDILLAMGVTLISGFWLINWIGPIGMAVGYLLGFFLAVIFDIIFYIKLYKINLLIYE